MNLSRDPDLAVLQLAAGRTFIESLGLKPRDVQYDGIHLGRRFGRDVIEIVLLKRDRHGHATATRRGDVATRKRRFPVHRLTARQTRALNRIKEIL